MQKLKTFCDFQVAHATLCVDRRGPGAKTAAFVLRFAVRARPSAGIGVGEVQLARATLCGDRRGRGAKTRGFCVSALRAAFCVDRACRIALVKCMEAHAEYSEMHSLKTWTDGCVSWKMLCARPSSGGLPRFMFRLPCFAFGLLFCLPLV